MAHIEVDVRRVSWRFYTWRLQYGDDIRFGTGPKKAARFAVRRFIAARGGEPVYY